MPYLLQQLLAISARQSPGKEAVAFRDRGLSYQQLDTLSNQLAQALARNGIVRGDRVGIYLNKSLESVVAIFGILKAGAAYVPLDPAAPPRRVAFILNNCAMKALISTRKKVTGLGGALPEPTPLACVVLTDAEGTPGESRLCGAKVVPWPEVLTSPAEAPPQDLIEDDLAYILYTSGSTGEPKGVMISHRASLTFVDWAVECLGVQATDRLSNHAPLHFDLSTFDIFAAMKAGAAVIVVPEELSIFPVQLARFIEEKRITIWYSVPSVLTRLVLHADLKDHRFADLSKILFAGEVFPVKYLRQLKSLVPHAAYYNLYGPTETNVCTYYEAGDIPPDHDEPLPIGKACANTEVFAVTDQGTLAPPGEVGELYVRGPSLMKGYWGLPERTRQVLVSNPLRPPWDDAKVYRTGDLVKQGPDGNYLFLGRRDNMIKSRGYRIELGEIESTLYRHPRVEEVAVIAIPDDQIGNVIKAVVVTRDRAELSRGEVESFCSDYLPKYMVPGLVECRASLPKTSTMKVDKPSLVKEHLQTRTS